MNIICTYNIYSWCIMTHTIRKRVNVISNCNKLFLLYCFVLLLRFRPINYYTNTNDTIIRNLIVVPGTNSNYLFFRLK